MSASAKEKTAEIKTELKAMERIEKILVELQPGVMRRVGTWVSNYASELADAKEAASGTA